jgi:hypothetical protein
MLQGGREPFARSNVSVENEMVALASGKYRGNIMAAGPFDANVSTSFHGDALLG